MGKNILVISPHADDEVLGVGGYLLHEKEIGSEDYWISAYNAYINRYCWIDTRFSVVGSHTFGNTGGCSSYRTKEVEMEDTVWLRQMFGDSIQMKKDTKLAKRKHEFQRTLSIPF